MDYIFTTLWVSVLFHTLILIKVTEGVSPYPSSSSPPWCASQTGWTLAGFVSSRHDPVAKCRHLCRTRHDSTLAALTKADQDGDDVECRCGNDTPVTMETNWGCEYTCQDGLCGGSGGLFSVYPVCTEGLYGSSCTKRCPGRCTYNICDVITGHCLAGCVDGWHGAKCGRECGHCARGACFQLSGTCAAGCLDGWFTSTCSEQCPDHCKHAVCSRDTRVCTHGCESGWFGPDCETRCPTNCRSTSCDSVTGACLAGCIPGWIGPCCDSPCPEACPDGPCDSEGCLHRAQRGYLDYSLWTADCPANCVGCDANETYCKACVAGSWGEICTKDCPPNCNNTLCDMENGTCSSGCEPGWLGNNCTEDIDECEPSEVESVCGEKPSCYNTPGSFRCCSEGLVYQPDDLYFCYDSSLPVWIWPVLVISLLVGGTLGVLGYWLHAKHKIKLSFNDSKKRKTSNIMPDPGVNTDDPRYSSATSKVVRTSSIKHGSKIDDYIEYEDTTKWTTRPLPTVPTESKSGQKPGNDYINRKVVDYIRQNSKQEEQEMEEYEYVREQGRPARFSEESNIGSTSSDPKRGYVNTP